MIADARFMEPGPRESPWLEIADDLLGMSWAMSDAAKGFTALAAFLPSRRRWWHFWRART